MKFYFLTYKTDYRNLRVYFIAMKGAHHANHEIRVCTHP